MKLMDRIQDVKRIPEQIDRAGNLIAFALGCAVAALIMSVIALINSGRVNHAN